MNHLHNHPTLVSNTEPAEGESGQIIPWAVLLMLLFLGMCALVVDVGHAMLVKRELQASTDAAALAAAQSLPNSSYISVGKNFSAQGNQRNSYNDFSVGTPSVTGYCSSTVASWGIPCTSTSPNAVVVTETTVIPMFFAEFLGVDNMTLSAISTASKGSIPLPYNVAIILDTTPSMSTADTSCGMTQLQCAFNGVQQLLKGLSSTADYVGLYTFPNLRVKPGNDSSGNASSAWCDGTQSGQSDGNYTFPSSTATSLANVGVPNGSGNTRYYTYQVTEFLNDYQSTGSGGTTTVSTGSQLSNSIGVGNTSGCSALKASTDMNTYYAAAIYAAQAALKAEQAARPGSSNAIVLLSDGDATATPSNMVTSGVSNPATSNGTYPSWANQCTQGVKAANYASSQGTTVYTVAYGAKVSSGCYSDTGSSAITPCDAMRKMSTGYTSGDTSHFYSDFNAPGGEVGCSGAGTAGVDDLAGIFSSIAGSLRAARLIPNGTA